MLTVDFDRLDLRPGMTVLDLGCGEGRHAFEAYRRGASVVALDWGISEVGTTKRWLGAIEEAEEASEGARYEVVRGTSVTPPAVAGKTVRYGLRALVAGSAWAADDSEETTVAGRDLVTGLLRRVTLTGGDVRRALEARGVEVHVYDGSELSLKGDGGPTCLTAPLLRGDG